MPPVLHFFSFIRNRNGLDDSMHQMVHKRHQTVHDSQTHSNQTNGRQGAVAETERISFICDSKLKADANEMFEKLGLTLTSGIKIYLQAVIREQAIPFRIEAASSRNANDERMM